MTKKELLTRVMRVPGVSSAEQAEQTVTAVFQVLRDRITPDEADDVWAQLPSSWKEMWESGNWWEKISSRVRGMNKLHREAFVQRVSELIPSGVDAEQAVRTVFHGLKEQISPGEAADVSSQLPEDLRTLWKAA